MSNTADIQSESTTILPMTAGDALRPKGNAVVTIAPERSIRDAIHTLTSHGVGSLLVVEEGDRIVGMLTERDVLRAADRHFDRMGDLTVADLMTREVIIGLEEDSLDSVMELMTERRIRHLPILSRGKLAGILSLGDTVKAKARNAEYVVRHFKDYIHRRYPG